MSASVKTDHTPQEIETIAVLGAGTMGHGIAQVAAAAGYCVILRDTNREALVRAVQAIERNLRRGIQLGKVTETERDQTLQRVRGTISSQETRQVDLFCEVISEVMDLK